MPQEQMTSEDVIRFCSDMDELAIEVWLEGGWGVDALLEKQTRLHADLDIFIQQRDVTKLRESLGAKGYNEIKLEIAQPHNFVLCDNKGHEIDVHVIIFNDEGDAIYGPVENAEQFLAGAFSGIGKINRRSIRCISAECQVKFHTGYELREKDFADVFALCGKFGIAYPDELAK